MSRKYLAMSMKNGVVVYKYFSEDSKLILEYHDGALSDCTTFSDKGSTDSIRQYLSDNLREDKDSGCTLATDEASMRKMLITEELLK